ncbi:MAG: hypothetical protein WB760_31575 [Xanthobacteraceae bacterium]
MPGLEDMSVEFGQNLIARKVKIVEDECRTRCTANKDQRDQREDGEVRAARPSGSERRRNDRRESQKGASCQKSRDQNDP